jgi:hypothetical protein
MNRAVLIVPACVLVAFAGTATLLTGWFILGAGAAADASCHATPALDSHHVPSELRPLFAGAAAEYDLGPEGASILAAINSIETGFGQNLSVSSAGAVGWMQFMPETWREFGVDADGDGRRDPRNPADAIYAAASYLRHLGAPRNWHDAIYGYNHAESYVDEVLKRARRFAATESAGDTATFVTCELAADVPLLGRGHRVYGGGRMVAIPGERGETIDERVLPDLLALRAQFHFNVTDGYAPTGHAAGGEHPLGLAVDIVPGPGGGWNEIDALAAWAEPQQNHPRRPFRWVGYDGDPGHGRGNHLHLSWRHAPAGPGARSVRWVEVVSATR